MRVVRYFLVALVLCAGFAAVHGAVASASTLALRAKYCSVFTGPAWNDPFANDRHGKKYSVSVVKYNCKTAISYVRKLVTHKVYGIPRVFVKGGPKGWKCTATASKSGLAFQGECRKYVNSFTGPNFTWTSVN